MITEADDIGAPGHPLAKLAEFFDSDPFHFHALIAAVASKYIGAEEVDNRPGQQ